MNSIQKQCFPGVPSEEVKGLRPILWRLVLGSLPTKTAEWTKIMEDNFKTYEDFKKELIVKPKLKDEEAKKEMQK